MKPDSFTKNALRLCVTSVLLMVASNAHAATLAEAGGKNPDGIQDAVAAARALVG